MKTLPYMMISFLAVVSSAFGESYTVKKGDTAYSIARKHKMSAESLMKMNEMDEGEVIRPGQELKLKASSLSSSAKGAPVEKSYEVKKGDTFYRVARENGLSVSQLKALNPSVEPGRILVGMTLQLSGVAEKPSSTKAQKSLPPKAAPKPQVPAIAKKPAPASRKADLPVYAPAPSSSERNTDLYVPASYGAPLPSVDLSSGGRPSGSMISSDGEPDVISSVTVKEEVTYGAFAKKNKVTTSQLNELNGLNLKSSTTLAKGSELYVPVKYH